jgi:hypothetical protein
MMVVPASDIMQNVTSNTDVVGGVPVVAGYPLQGVHYMLQYAWHLGSQSFDKLSSPFNTNPWQWNVSL